MGDNKMSDNEMNKQYNESKGQNKIRHIGIIMDGNRRWARAHKLEAWKGHEAAADNLDNLCRWCKEFGVKELTLYAFSTENFKRTEIEKKMLFKLFKQICVRLLEDSEVEKEELKVRFIGKLELFDEELQQLMDKVMKETENHNGLILNIAAGYGGRQEIVDGVRKVIGLVKNGMINEEDIDVDTFKEYLYLKSEPELIIRTGGASRLSNFLMWQSAYCELIFIETLWPDFSKEDLRWCLDEFGRRERRFGQ